MKPNLPLAVALACATVIGLIFLALKLCSP